MQRVARSDLRAHFFPLLLFLLLISSGCGSGGEDLELQTEHNPTPSEPTKDASDALSPDDTLFAHLRCFERFASKHRADREQDVIDWLGADRDRYLNNTERTPYFLQCVLTKLGLYDAKKEAFSTKTLVRQFNKYRNWMSLSEEAVQLFTNDTESIVLGNSTPEEVYHAFEPIFQTHYTAYFQLFLREPTVLQKLYNQKEFPVRKPNQTMIEFCELQMSGQLWNDICQIRSYEISNRTGAMEAHIDCIFRGFHYLTPTGFINEIEIIQDFAKATVLKAAAERHIRECAKEAAVEVTIRKRSLRMYRCLLDGGSKEQFKEAFDFREVRSGNLTYLLRNLPYDRDQVKQQILALDMERCDDRQRPTGRIGDA